MGRHAIEPRLVQLRIEAACALDIFSGNQEFHDVPATSATEIFRDAIGQQISNESTPTCES